MALLTLEAQLRRLQFHGHGRESRDVVGEEVGRVVVGGLKTSSTRRLDWGWKGELGGAADGRFPTLRCDVRFAALLLARLSDT